MTKIKKILLVSFSISFPWLSLKIELSKLLPLKSQIESNLSNLQFAIFFIFFLFFSCFKINNLILSWYLWVWNKLSPIPSSKNHLIIFFTRSLFPILLKELVSYHTFRRCRLSYKWLQLISTSDPKTPKNLIFDFSLLIQTVCNSNSNSNTINSNSTKNPAHTNLTNLIVVHPLKLIQPKKNWKLKLVSKKKVKHPPFSFSSRGSFFRLNSSLMSLLKHVSTSTKWRRT